MWIWKRLGAFFSDLAIRRRERRRISRTSEVVAVIQQLEPRIVLTAVTGYEVYFLALINRARQDPVAEAARLGIDLNEGLPAGTIAPGARQPLALNNLLQTSIDGHMLDELANNYFSHTGSNGSTFDQRIEAAGYTGWTTIGENLGIEYTSGAVNITQFVTDEYVNLFMDASEPGRGHRINMLDGDFRDVGSSVEVGTYMGYNAVDTGNDFGAMPGNASLTGVIYNDSVSVNNFYNVGEGIGGANVMVVGGGNTFQTTANAAGGYEIALAPGSYTVTFSGTGISTPITKSFTIGSLNVEVDANTKTDIVAGGPPALLQTNPVNYLEASAAKSIDSLISVSDSGRLTLSTATVTISNFVANQDLLGFVPNVSTMGNIIMSSDSNGVLNLSSAGATATLAQWQATLRAVTYANSSNNPSITTRNVTFVVNDGSITNQVSNTLAMTIAITAVNNPPQLSASETTLLAYNVLSAPGTISSSLLLIDADNSTTASATIQITSGYQNGADVLTFANTAKIAGAFNVATGTLTLSGTDTVANYQAAIRSVMFSNTSATPTVGVRTLSIQANDGSAANNLSNFVTRTVNVTTVGPVLYQIESTPLSAIGPLFTPVTSSLRGYEQNVSNWTGATITIASNYQSNQDLLSFKNTAIISGTWNAAAGTLTLTGADSIANYRTALLNVDYHNTSATPNTALTRTISINVTDGQRSSNTVFRALTVRADSGSPILSGTTSVLTFVEGAAALTIAPNLVVTHPEGLNISSATVSFTNWQGGDRLDFSNIYALQHTFTVNTASSTAILTITGIASTAQYQKTLESVLYWSVAGNPVTWLQRVATLTVTDILSNSGSTTQNIAINPVANSAPPLVSGVNGTETYVQSAAPIAVVPNLVVTQPSGLNLYSATISFTNWQGGDRLQFSNIYALQHTFTVDPASSTAVLSITGFGTAAQYQTTLQSVVYWSVAGNPVTWLQRVATIVVTDIYSNSGSATQNLAVNTVANSAPPVVSGVSGTVTYVKSTVPIRITPNLVVTQPNGLNVYSATVSFTNWQGGDRLSFSNIFAFQHTFSENLTTNTAILTITGFGTAAQYQTTLRSVVFWALAGNLNTSTRLATITLTDLNAKSGSGVENVAVSN